ncbi:hypothetical protein PINS_up006331 [Pythium insidiosum]|nr:hypothetical protein PINS_up006331 [Pythium insidiosum]
MRCWKILKGHTLHVYALSSFLAAMASAPPAADPNARRTWLSALQVLSPTSLLRARRADADTDNDAALVASPAGRVAPTPAILDALSHLVQFLEENHRRVEGLYRRDGVASECVTLVRRCCGDDAQLTSSGVSSTASSVQHSLPDLARFSAHSVTGAVKGVLRDRLEPLVPYATTAALLQRLEDGRATNERDEIKVLELLIELMKQLDAPTREFLKLFLIHLYHVMSFSVSQHYLGGL